MALLSLIHKINQISLVIFKSNTAFIEILFIYRQAEAIVGG